MKEKSKLVRYKTFVLCIEDTSGKKGIIIKIKIKKSRTDKYRHRLWELIIQDCIFFLIL